MKEELTRVRNYLLKLSISYTEKYIINTDLGRPDDYFKGKRDGMEFAITLINDILHGGN